MDSQTTLTDFKHRTIRLVFSPNSTLNARILVNGQARYNVSTTDRSVTKTKILDAATQREIVSVKKRTLLPDKISFADRYEGKEQKLNDVLKSHKLDDGFPVHLIHTGQGDFYWKIHPVYRLALFSMSDPVHPVAYRETVAEPTATFALVINRELESITDYIISTFLVLEQRLRMEENNSRTATGVAELTSLQLAADFGSGF